MKNLINSKPAKAAYFIIGMLFIVTLTFLVTTNSRLSASDEDARIFFETLEHDFGNVQQGTALEHSFKFRNEGDKPLMIENVHSSCGCTGQTTDGKNEYAGGEDGEIKITFNTQGREGHVEKNITVSTNDILNSRIILKFKCDIIK